MEPENNNNTLKKGLLGMVTLVLVASVGIYLSGNKNKQTNEEIISGEVTNVATKTPQTSGEQVKPSTLSTSLYKNGTYSATGSYSSPAGKEDVTVSLTLADDVITQATFTGGATNKGSVYWQGKFSEGFNQVVVGKKIGDLSLTIVNGSSLTPKGFQDAVSKIKTEAKI